MNIYLAGPVFTTTSLIIIAVYYLALIGGGVYTAAILIKMIWQLIHRRPVPTRYYYIILTYPLVVILARQLFALL